MFLLQSCLFLFHTVLFLHYEFDSFLHFLHIVILKPAFNGAAPEIRKCCNSSVGWLADTGTGKWLNLTWKLRDTGILEWVHCLRPADPPGEGVTRHPFPHSWEGPRSLRELGSLFSGGSALRWELESPKRGT